MSVTKHSTFNSSLIEVDNQIDHDLLARFASKFKITQNDSSHELVIRALPKGLELQWLQPSGKPLSFYIDVEKFVGQQRTFPAPKQGAFNQALGRKTKHVIDATGGWGADTLLMCAQGYQVTLIERSPIMAMLLKDAMQRLSHTAWSNTHSVIVPNVIEGDAIELLKSDSLSADCIYLDPMFPPKRKKSAAVNKNMQLLQYLVGEDLDANELLQAAVDGSCPRIAVKRPDYAELLGAQIDGKKVMPATQFYSKLVHYDVYLKTELL